MVTRKRIKTDTPKKGGRSKIDFNFEEFLSLLAQGKTRTQIANLMGMSPATLYNNLSRLEEDKSDEEIREIRESIKKNEKVGKQVNIDNLFDVAIKLALEGNVTLLVFLLKVYGGMKETERHELTGADGKPIEFDQEELARHLTTEQLLEIARLDDPEEENTSQKTDSGKRAKET